MNDRRFDPIGLLISLTWAVVLCALGLTLAVSLLRDIWPWLLGGVVIVVLAVAVIRLLVWSRSRPW